MNFVKNWEDLKFWQSGEWQVLEERFHEWDSMDRRYNPGTELLFAALDIIPFSDVRVLWLGQDPYPNHSLCTGLAFSIPRSRKDFPPSLSTILKELTVDMGYETLPSHGDLRKWCKQGVLLLNSIPTCDPGKPGSHAHWPEWRYLISEIVTELDRKGIVFCFVGGKARDYAKGIQDKVEEKGVVSDERETRSTILEVGHPSPVNRSKPFSGSRIFSRINHALVQNHGEDPIDWRL